MSGFQGCIDQVRQASGNRLTDTEAMDVLDRVARHMNQLEAQGVVARADDRLRRLGRDEAAKLQRQLALERKQAAIMAIRRQRIDRHIETMRAAGRSAKDALLSLMHGLEGVATGIRRSAWATSAAYEQRYLGGIMGRIARDMPHVEPMLKDAAFNERVAREMEQIGKQGGRPGLTGDADARRLAEIYAEHAEMARRDANALGADIPQRQGWTPHTHDSMRLLRTTPKEWARKIKAALDLGLTFGGMSDAEIDEALAQTYRDITTGRDQVLGQGESIEQMLGTRNIAQGLHKRRELHFRSTDAWLAYNREFGHGTVTGSVFDHLHKLARNAGAMEIFGPDPLRMLERVANEQAQAIRNDASIDAKKARKQIAALGRVKEWASTRVMTGEAFIVGNTTIAQWGEGLRVWQALSKLGAVTISAITDPVVLANNLRFQGKGFAQAYGDVFRHYLKGRGKGEDRAFAFLLGEGYSGLIDRLITPYAAADSPIGTLSGAAATFFRWSGLTGFTDVGRAAGSRIMAADMGRHAATAWQSLPERYRHVLRLHGIDAKRWEAVRRTAYAGQDGTPYLTPDRIARLDDNAIAGLVTDQIDALRQRVAGQEFHVQRGALIERIRVELEIDFRRFFADELSYGVLVTDARQQKVTTGGYRPGTLGGEAVRVAMQLKGFPMGFSQRVIGRALKSGPRGATPAQTFMKNAGHAGELVATLWVAGLFASWGKDLARGQTPKELWGDDGLNWATVAAAMVQSGGAGIYGDFLFASSNRFGRSPIETFTGPVVGEILGKGLSMLIDAKNAEPRASQITSFALGNTPFLNLFYVRPALDFLVLNSLRESVSPGFLKRQAKRAREEFGQSYILPREAF